jgi:hypothetical protein
MYRGFKLSNLSFTVDTAGFMASGETMALSHQVAVKRTLDAFVSSEGKIDGSKLQEHWFPQIEADVFISHSHRDEALAITIAGWLKQTFGLEAFIDSCVWGYADTLLKQIDDKYCLNPGGETYSYEKRNGSTSHIHMMLATALGMMIDNTECLFFLNTPNAITSDEAVSKTQSPWLYSEIAITHIVQRKTPAQHRELIKISESIMRKSALASITIEYALNTTSLTDISGATLSEWQRGRSTEEANALDTLYRIAPVRM